MKATYDLTIETSIPSLERKTASSFPKEAKNRDFSRDSVSYWREDVFQLSYYNQCLYNRWRLSPLILKGGLTRKALAIYRPVAIEMAEFPRQLHG